MCKRSLKRAQNPGESPEVYSLLVVGVLTEEVDGRDVQGVTTHATLGCLEDLRAESDNKTH